MRSHIDAAASLIMMMMMMMREEEKQKEEEGSLQGSCLIREDRQLVGSRASRGANKNLLAVGWRQCGCRGIRSSLSIYEEKGLDYYSSLGETLSKLLNLLSTLLQIQMWHKTITNTVSFGCLKLEISVDSTKGVSGHPDTRTLTFRSCG